MRTASDMLTRTLATFHDCLHYILMCFPAHLMPSPRSALRGTRPRACNQCGALLWAVREHPAKTGGARLQGGLEVCRGSSEGASV